MTTITFNPRTKAGKTLLEFVQTLAISNKSVKISDEFIVNDSKFNSKKLNLKQLKWIDKLKKVKKEIDNGTFKGKSAQSFLDEL